MTNTAPAAVDRSDHTAVSVSEPRWSRLLDVLALLGVAFVIYQAWGIVSWAFSDEFAEVSPSSDATAAQRKGAIFSYLLMWSIAAAWLVHLVRDYRRHRALTWGLVVSAAWLLTVWQESMANVTGPRYAWNAAFLDRGDWTQHLPFVSTDGPGLTMPLLMEPFVFFGLLSAIGFGIAALMRFLNRKTGLGGWALTALTYVIVLVVEFGTEMASMAQGMHAYPLAYGPLTIFDGTEMQFPLYENWLLGLMWALPGFAIYFLRDAQGGLKLASPPRWRPGRSGAVLTTMAAVGALNVPFLIYNLIAFVWLPGDTVAPMPPWLAP